MPTPSRAVLGATLSRRAALAGLAAGVAGSLVGCTPRGVKREEDPEPVEPEVDPDVAIATEALTAQQSMIALITATQARHRRLERRLAPLLAAHEAHAALLADAVPDQPDQPTPTASATVPAPTETPGNRVPRDPARAVRALASAEQELVTATKQHAFKAQSGAFARVLGSMAAAAAQHTAILAPPQDGAS